MGIIMSILDYENEYKKLLKTPEALYKEHAALKAKHENSNVKPLTPTEQSVSIGTDQLTDIESEIIRRSATETGHAKGYVLIIGAEGLGRWVRVGQYTFTAVWHNLWVNGAWISGNRSLVAAPIRAGG